MLEWADLLACDHCLLWLNLQQTHKMETFINLSLESSAFDSKMDTDRTIHLECDTEKSGRCLSLQQHPIDNKQSETTEAETGPTKSCVSASLSKSLGPVPGQVDRASERTLPWSSHVQLNTCTEEWPWPSSRCSLNGQNGLAVHTCGQISSARGSVQIKRAWCPATTVDMPGQERQKMQSNRAITWLLCC